MPTLTTLLKSPVAAISLLLAAVPATAADFFLKNGDKVVMMGDSITEQHLYGTYVEAKRTAAFNERMEKMPGLFEAIRKSLVMQAHQVEIVTAAHR